MSIDYLNLGDIKVNCLLIRDECILQNYVGGNGCLVVPDFVENEGKKYYVKKIPSDWSDGENNITGLEFECQHLKKICESAFEGTNCLDKYIDTPGRALEFPEGLEEIGNKAFAGTDKGQNSIYGYSFPSTLKKIGECSFGNKAPYINTLKFKSNPEIHKKTFYIIGAPVHNCRSISAPTLEMARAIKDNLKSSGALNDFNTAQFFLAPMIIDQIPDLVIEKFGDINVSCSLIADECIMCNAWGTGTLKIPDHISYKDKNYYIKQIPSDWSGGNDNLNRLSTNITGLEFAQDCTHLKKICDSAFQGTNCLDEYIADKTQLLRFPEGLEEIGDNAFSNTDRGQNKIKGYSFPSTLKKIGTKAFGLRAPYIDGDDNNGVLEFRSIPEIHKDAFYIIGAPSHDCKYIFGRTQEMAEQIVKIIKDNMSDDFSTGSDYLTPQVIEEKS